MLSIYYCRDELSVIYYTIAEANASKDPATYTVPERYVVFRDPLKSQQHFHQHFCT